jgi:hypothetical protein
MRARASICRPVHRLRCVQENIEHHLLQFSGPRQHRRARRAGIVDADALAGGTVAQQSRRRIHCVVDRDRGRRIAGNARKITRASS